MVIGECQPRHRAKEFLRFLRRIDWAVPGPRKVQLVLDKHACHKTPQLMAWPEKHPRFMQRFTAAGTFRMNLGERFFARITSKRIRRGICFSIAGLKTATYDFLQQQNAKPFAWTKTEDDILAYERRALNSLYEIRRKRKQVSDSEHQLLIELDALAMATRTNGALGGPTRTPERRTDEWSVIAGTE